MGCSIGRKVAPCLVLLFAFKHLSCQARRMLAQGRDLSLCVVRIAIVYSAKSVCFPSFWVHGLLRRVDQRYLGSNQGAA